MDWPAPAPILAALNITAFEGAEPVKPESTSTGALTQTAPPVPPSKTSGGQGGSKATLPGQDARNKKLGDAGEYLVLEHERRRLLKAGKTDLAARLVHVAVVEGDSAGYDIRSFNDDGSDRHIEVKTTKGPASNAFFLSPNEVRFSEDNPGSYVLVRVHAYNPNTNSANYYELAGNVHDHFDLTPSEYRARIANAQP